MSKQIVPDTKAADMLGCDMELPDTTDAACKVVGPMFFAKFF